MKEWYKRLPIFWKITIVSVIIFLIFLLFIGVAQTAIFFDWFFDHKNKYGIKLGIFDDIFQSYGLILIITLLFGIVISVIGGIIISRMLLSNVRDVISTMENIKKEGRLDKRVKVSRSNDEISQLGIVFNSLMDDVENSFNREKRFVQDASHELKTPLTIIKGHLSLLNRWGKNDPEVLNKSIKVSSEEVDRLIILVNNLLDMSKLENENEKLKGNCDLKEVVDIVLNDFSILNNDYKINYKNNNVYVFNMKAEHLKQILIILLDNAIKYSKREKYIDVIIEEDSNFQVLTVRDKGVGIPKDDIPFLFDRFYRVDKSRNSKTGGNGLGLSIANRIISLYGGKISVHSIVGEGTSFKVIIPK
ncbi:sensor histidine kinase [Clostridium baratii]|uniref:sensor histidine kinase n=1 Tax=Clostridium baratii TaxID=1561 RepID=UPI00069B5713|nr:HAMP domain-containing sensor histidine kinase [Clostridium baratii]